MNRYIPLVVKFCVRAYCDLARTDTTENDRLVHVLVGASIPHRHDATLPPLPSLPLTGARGVTAGKKL